MRPTVVGALFGLAFATGLLSALLPLLTPSRPSLDSRVLPYVRDVPLVIPTWTSRRPSDHPGSALAALLTPGLARAADRLGRLLGGHESVRRRLQRAGFDSTVEAFRLAQVRWGLASAGGCLVIGLLGPGRQPGRAVSWLLLCAGAGLFGIMVRDHLLTRQAKAREQRILAEFPVVADLLALSVAAGEGPIGALSRVVSTCRGPLADELAVVLAQSRTGVSVSAALDALSRRSGLPIMARFAEGVAVAIERGTPLVDVLAAQAGDVREASRRALIESGARKEVAMMLPIVFLIMPITLLFAFFPGVVGLNLLTP
jgi:tight adherence protein C